MKSIFAFVIFFLVHQVSGRADMNMDHATYVSPQQCDQAYGWTDDMPTDEQKKIIKEVVGDRSHRTEHALWHASRSGFEENTESVANAYGSDWINPDALCPAPNKSASKYNPAGEDFLYMHRGMVSAIRSALIAAKLPCIRGWGEIPDPKIWPVPDGENKKDAKSDDTLAQLKSWDWYFQSKDPKALEWRQSITLSQMGFALEFTIHNNLHMRYATLRPALEFQSSDGNDGANLPLDKKFPANWNFDNILPKSTYDWLADPYGAAVNPLFWKIHGYVDSLVDRWLKDNNYVLISDDCTGKQNCYEWQGRWVGTDLHINPPPPVKGIYPGGSSRQGPVGQQPPPKPSDNDFKILRMKLAHLGVLKDKPPTSGGVKSPPPSPTDPYSMAVSSVCGGR